MICVSIQNKNIEEIFEIIDRGLVEMAEIRLDKCDLSLEEIEELFSTSDIPLIATCRTSITPASLAESRLLTAIGAGAAYVDLEIEAPAMMSKRVRREAQECGTVLIRSFHDFEGTDSIASLTALVEKCQHLGAELVKIVTTARSKEDCDKVLSLYNNFDPAELVAFCMGEEGKESRIACLAKGAPFSYAALNEDEQTAPGQWSMLAMTDRVYGSHRFVGYDRLDGEIPVLRMPSSKSFAQRAIIFAALAQGESILRGYSECGDNSSAIQVAKAIGAKVEVRDDRLIIKGTGGRILPLDTLHTGESGFLTRLMIPILSGLSSKPVTITGEKTLLSRPLTGAKEMMGAFGVDLTCEGEEAMIPLIVSGKIKSGETIEISGKSGSQLVSGLLATLPLMGNDSVVILREPKSIPYIYITLDVLNQFGVKVVSEMEGGEEFMETQDWSLCDAITFRIKGGQKYKSTKMSLEADWSSAANFLVAGALFGRVELEGLDTKSLQADLSILDILTNAGASISQLEETGVIHIQRAPLKAFDVDAGNCPDLFPILAVLASFCQGQSRIAGVGRLANKESNRAKAIEQMLSQMGVKCSIKGDKLIVEGHSLTQRLLTDSLLKSGNYSSDHDHRMVMALNVASFGADGPIVIDDTECVGKSFPSFYEIFEQL